MNAFSDVTVVIPVVPNDQSWRRRLNELLLFGSEIEIILSVCQRVLADQTKIRQGVD
jgi:hypothetical protein